LFILSSLSITKKNKIIILVLLLLIIASVVIIYAFNLLPSIKKGVETIKNNNGAVQTVSEERSIALPDQINTSGDCVVLDKENCSLGKAIYENNQLTAVGFNIPKGGGVYAPFKGKYEKNAPTSLSMDGIGYPSVELMDISRDDWGVIDTRSYFSVVAYTQLPIATETLEEKQTITVLTETGKVRGSYNLILTFKEYNRKTNEWKTNIDLLKQYFPNLEIK
jgi:hypothetical protein